MREIVLLGAAAVLIFWMVGAYNRIVAMRLRIVQSWAQVDEPMRRRRETLPLLLAVLREAWPQEQGAVEAASSALQQAAAAADALRAKPAHAPAAAQFVMAERQLASALARLSALLDQHPDLRSNPEVAGWQRELHDAEQRQAFARQLFNDAVAAYNDAAHQWPTRLLVKLYGFEDAGPL
ncbi:LemA family protein [Aquincola sp. MAHUQ-54]|uniref:LemA family protein n=1 Tax=Aquincola agrisoli TaxID=3119538 RepID=A0AAW9QKB7_9BURK